MAIYALSATGQLVPIIPTDAELRELREYFAAGEEMIEAQDSEEESA